MKLYIRRVQTLLRNPGADVIEKIKLMDQPDDPIPKSTPPIMSYRYPRRESELASDQQKVSFEWAPGMDTTEPGCVVVECRYCMARKQSLINNNTSKEVSSVLTAQNPNANNKPIKQRQSPIDIRIAKLHYAPEVCRPELLKLSYHSGDCGVLYVNPTGFRVDASENSQTTISAPHLPSGRFRFAQFHAHWGADQHCGSEHRLNGRSYAGEVHFVFYNIKYGNFCSAANHRDGLSVLAVFIRGKKFPKMSQKSCQPKVFRNRQG
ncbi:hypothetical protein WR25_12543 isoform B [Diploscapter pachys]|uniref:Carbonic anhydrase n=1 Tax=Diploscapter pachys TaxID=2018661 RepID=A0A2A2JRB7_9BILA|nr:hypothetical protein WR25_12543 isoform B [Diploscapter pachys]